MSLPAILDTSILNEITGNAGPEHNDMLTELLGLLFESAQSQIRAINCAAPDDFPCIVLAAHTLKGGAASIGAEEVAQIAGQIERQARLKQMGPWSQLAAELGEAVLRLRRAAVGMGLQVAA